MYVQFEFTTSSTSYWRQFNPLQQIPRTFILLDIKILILKYQAVSHFSLPQRVGFFQLVYNFSALIGWGFCSCSPLSPFCNGIEWRESFANGIASEIAWERCRRWAGQDSSSAVVMLVQVAAHLARTIWSSSFDAFISMVMTIIIRKTCKCAFLLLALEKFLTRHFLTVVKIVNAV